MSVRGDPPGASEPVLQRPAAVSPEHVLHRHRDRGTGGERLLESLVHVRHVDVETDRRGTQGLGTPHRCARARAPKGSGGAGPADVRERSSSSEKTVVAMEAETGASSAFDTNARGFTPIRMPERDVRDYRNPHPVPG